MHVVPERLRFNADASASVPQSMPTDGVIEVPSGRPLVELLLDQAGIAAQPGQGAVRVPKQCKPLGRLELEPVPGDPFGPALDWAYRCYQVLSPAGGAPFRSHLYLFNVLVALEWEPSAAEFEQLQIGFRRASDFLFDATDGWMAFGQVVFGGPELMDGADIQIMASNRLLPRSWVGSLHPHAEYHADQKYTPIRVGRGIWHDVRQRAIGWDEPEAYRLLIHEWGHYALKLTDEYLETRPLLLRPSNQPAGGAAHTLRAAPSTSVVMLKIPTSTDSIMATAEGTSELVTQQWAKISAIYPRVGPRAAGDVRIGPIELPAALPRFRQLKRAAGAKPAPSQVALPAWSQLSIALGRLLLPEDVRLDHCWVYVLKGLREGKGAGLRLLAQGTLETRSADTAFPLLGAAPGDTVLLINQTNGRPTSVLRAEIPATGELAWVDATPPAFPMIDVVPEPVEPNTPVAELVVRLHDVPGGEAPEQVYLFPLGQPADESIVPLKGAGTPWASKPQRMRTLDGHVLLRWKHDRMLVCAFSQGGDGPYSSRPYPANPMNAGSSDGQTLIFMYKDDASAPEPNDVKLVTTRMPGLDGTPPGGVARSSAFSIAGNAPLLLRLNPTLTMYYDPFDDAEQAWASGGDLAICRWSGGGWQPVPTYVPAGYRVVVAPLDQASGGALIAPVAAAPRVEYYKVCWIPRAAADTGA
ncbi:MAG: hypothetical protein U0Z44_14185 [Kouleothrix sp.]